MVRASKKSQAVAKEFERKKLIAQTTGKSQLEQKTIIGNFESTKLSGREQNVEWHATARQKQREMTSDLYMQIFVVICVFKSVYNKIKIVCYQLRIFPKFLLRASFSRQSPICDTLFFMQIIMILVKELEHLNKYQPTQNAIFFPHDLVRQKTGVVFCIFEGFIDDSV